MKTHYFFLFSYFVGNWCLGLFSHVGELRWSSPPDQHSVNNVNSLHVVLRRPICTYFRLITDSLCDLIWHEEPTMLEFIRNPNSCPCLCCLAICYIVRFPIVFQCFLRGNPSKCLESACFEMLENSEGAPQGWRPDQGWWQARDGWLEQEGAKIFWTWWPKHDSVILTVNSCSLFSSLSLNLSVYVYVWRTDKWTGSSLLWDWCLYQTIITTLAVFSVSLKFDTM